jgi:16S rRNA pseudouridine516 synthase
MRIDRLLANLGYGSRREVTASMKSGRVRTRDGQMVKETSAVKHADLLFDGQPLDLPSPLNLLVHKPVGLICSTEEDEGSLIYDLLPPRFALRHPIVACAGRLDKDTSGLVLMTDDGQLNHRLISPKKEVIKIYEATLARPLQGHEAEIFARGDLCLDGEKKPCKPAQLETTDEPLHVRLHLTEGRYHQVRRMFAAVGNHVERLHRSQVGQLTLADLPEGQWRVLTEEDLALVFG